MLKGVHSLLEPFSIILHFLEGDKVPPSWVYPCYQCLLDMLAKLPDDVKDALDAETLDQVRNLVKERWLPDEDSRKVGLRNDLHLAAFALDPAVRAAFMDAQGTEPMMTPAVRAAVSNVFLTLSKAASSEVPEPGSSAARNRESLQRQRRLMLSSAYDTYCSETSVFGSELKAAREDVYKLKIERALQDMNDKDPHAKNNPVKVLLCKLKALGAEAGVAFWKRMSRISDTEWSEEAKASHQLLCSRAIDLLGIVISSCGTERHGKAYKLIHTALRTSISEQRLHRAIYVFFNLDLLDKQREQFTFDARDLADPESFILSVVEELETEEMKEMLRMEEEEDEAREMLPGSDKEETVVRLEPLAPALLAEEEYVLPDGFKEIDPPEQLDAALCRMKPKAHIFMRWEGSGWELGVIKSFYRNGVVLKDDRGKKKKERGNFNVDWIKDPPRVTRDMFLDKQRWGGGKDAPVGNWVLLQSVTG
uniref:Uncharacterized protein n=1 Tax=Hemiselmis andersenii TaxID=464988 RepID=A0A6T8PP65_HEMAN|mmetsp:Transcript_7087/g.17126  ORF Transcript_7087/g.17126 Transcript_7087/m.17126 type:complete len:478 (+) Transcript_7087:1682-3115(+)